MKKLIIILLFSSCTVEGRIARAVRVLEWHDLSVINLTRFPGYYFDTTAILYDSVPKNKRGKW